MKIEKLSDNQIRCTLNRTDLAERELKMSELAYGSEKARELFRDMMQQASFEFGFEADDIPLMIEAIPVSSDCIILMITKVEDPEELDTRFSKFAPSHDDFSEEDDINEDYEINSLFSKIQEIRDSMELSSDELDKLEDIADDSSDSQDDDKLFIPTKAAADSPADETAKSGNDAGFAPILRIFTFGSLNQVSEACSHICTVLEASSALYKDEKKNIYALVISNPSCDTDTLNRVCHILSEYGTRIRAQYATESYYKEHYATIIKENAVSILANL